jgi:hypothetical protein
MQVIIAITLGVGLVTGPVSSVCSKDSVAQTATCERRAPASSGGESNPAGNQAGQTLFVQVCPVPKCPTGQVVCNLRPQANGCMTWSCCQRR